MAIYPRAPDNSIVLERQVFNSVRHLLRFVDLCNQLQTGHALAYGHVELVRVDDPSEGFTCFLPPSGFTQEILILCENHAPHVHSSIEEITVIHSSRAVFLGR